MASGDVERIPGAWTSKGGTNSLSVNSEASC